MFLCHLDSYMVTMCYCLPTHCPSVTVQLPTWYLVNRGYPRGGHSTFFQVGVCGPDFRSVGLASWHLPLKRGACERKISKFGGLWAENFQIWGLVSWKFPNLGACELKLGWKFKLLRLKFQNFLKRESCKLTLLLEMGPLWAAGEAWKGGLQGRTSPYPLSRSVPPPPGGYPYLCWSKFNRGYPYLCWSKFLDF